MVLLYVMEMIKGDVFVIFMILVVEFVLIFIFLFIGGIFVDRWKLKKIMIWCEMLSFILVFVVLIMFMFGMWKIVFFVIFIFVIFL